MKNLSWYALFQICLGIFLIVAGCIRFLNSPNYLSESVFLGAGILFYGLADNTKYKQERKNTLTNIGAVFLTLGVILLLYNVLF